MKTLLVFASLVSALGADTIDFKPIPHGTNLVIISPPVTERMTNMPLVVATTPDPDPCPVCKGPSHHEFQLVRYSSFEVVKQTTEFQGQKKTHIIFSGTPTNWLQTNIIRRGQVRSSPGNFSSPPPLP